MTIEELLNLPIDGYKAIADMTEEQLKEYFKDIISLEPEIREPLILTELEIENLTEEEKEEKELLSSLSKNNPFKNNKRKKYESKITKKVKNEKQLEKDKEFIKELEKELGI